MYKCYGCERDVCGVHASCEEFPAGTGDCVFICVECVPSFIEANEKADKIMSDWMAERKRFGNNLN